MAVDCTGADENKNDNYKNALQETESDFLSNVKCLNPMRVNPIKSRMPKYRYKRFANPIDFKNCFPHEETLLSLDSFVDKST